MTRTEILKMMAESATWNKMTKIMNEMVDSANSKGIKITAAQREEAEKTRMMMTIAMEPEIKKAYCQHLWEQANAI